MSAILIFDFQRRKQLRFSEVNYLNYTKKDPILHVATSFSLKQGETRTSHGPIPHPLRGDTFPNDSWSSQLARVRIRLIRRLVRRLEYLLHAIDVRVLYNPVYCLFVEVFTKEIGNLNYCASWILHEHDERRNILPVIAVHEKWPSWKWRGKIVSKCGFPKFQKRKR